MMRKTLALLLCALLTIPCALASDGRAPQAAEGISITIDGEQLFLDFDVSPEYTTVEDGLVTASFYTYGPDEASLYELYLSFPLDVQPGDVVNAQYAMTHNAPDCSVAYIYSTEDEENYYLAGQLGNEIYPEGSEYAIAFDTVDAGESGTLYTGTLNATLVMVDLYSGKSGEVVSFQDAAFTFTLTSGPAIPRATSKPTLPPDMYRC